MNKSNIWMARVQDYLILRRLLGYKLISEETLLKSFAQFADNRCANRLDLKLATDWAQSSKSVSHITWGRRIDVIRGFAKFMLRIEPSTTVPSKNLFGSTHRRLIPHIFTQIELRELLKFTHTIQSPDRMKAENCNIIFGLLATSGLRISEVLNLALHDVDLQSGVLNIRDTKNYKHRLVPLHKTAIPHLQRYAQHRKHYVITPNSYRFFMRQNGQPVTGRSMLYALQSLCKQLNLSVRGDHSRHRLHDLRHTFIVHSLLRLYKQNCDIERGLGIISNYVGHARIVDTYWYLTGIPELMEIASERFYQFAKESL